MNNKILLFLFLITPIALFGQYNGINIEANTPKWDVVNQDTTNFQNNRIEKVWDSGGLVYQVEINISDDTLPIRLEIYNMLAKPVKTIYEGVPTTNIYQFDATGLPNGPYFCVLQGIGYRDTYKFTISR